ncbi:MAG: hypothetical protein ACLFU4_09440 [Opitutales bacterium]
MRPNLLHFSTVLIGLFALSACDRPEPTTYTVPKEERSATADPPVAAAPTAEAAPSSGMQVLPGMAEAAAAAPELRYEVPTEWEEFPPQSIRKANFRVEDASGRAEIAVTTFPGDVGGLLANVNRWRGQIELDPIQEDALDALTQPTVISNHRGTLVSLQGPNESILGGILRFHGNTWFFKMQGATGTVNAQADAMDRFLASVAIEDPHH